MSYVLPFFKFFPAKWDCGNITLEDFQTQGLFINICCYYWERDCILEIKNLKKKFNNHPSIEILIDAEIIKEMESMVKIEFLSEQFEELVERHEVYSENGKKGNEIRWGKARTKVNVSLADSPAIGKQSPPDRIKDKEEDKDITNVFMFWNKKKIIVHKELDSELSKTVKKALNIYSSDQLLDAISNYELCLNGDYFFSYKWRLADFLQREKFKNPAKFLKEGEHYENFVNKQPKQFAKNPV